ncbi:MAG: hypothetical protein R3C46_12945 [Hyphomonadaceae bacterium]
MIANALGAELYKLSRNTWSLFWAFGFMPVFALASGLLEQAYTHFTAGDLIPYASPLWESFSGFATFSVSIFQICGIAGAAIIFAGEYRWETWRAMLTRNDRLPVMLAKLLTFALAITVSLVLCALARFIVGLVDAALTHDASWPRADAGGIALGHLLAFTATFMQMMVTASFVMLVSVITRTMTAGIVATLLVLFACEIASIRGNAGGDPIWVLFPNIAAEGIRQAGRATMGDPDTLLSAFAMPGAAALVMWFVLLTTAALTLFLRQDLSRE